MLTRARLTSHRVDPKFCTGPKENPTPIGTVFGDLKFSGTKDHVVFTVNIQAWIEGIGAQSPSPDLLTTFENNAKDGSIGGLGSTTEKMFNSQRSVPLFEFRNLKGLRTSEIVGFMTEVDQSIQQLHKDYAIPPGGTTTDRKRRRQDSDGSACTSPIANPSSTPVPHCDTTADPSDVPYNVFYGSPMGSTDVFGNFCKAVDAATTQPLEWTTDASGNQKTSPSRLMRRTPPPNPSSHSDSKFALSWSPSSSGETCISNCYDAFVEINNSPCGHQGRQSNLLSKSASLDVACGTYSYTVTTGPARCEIGPVDEDDICAGTDCPSGTSAHCVPNEGPNAG